MKTNRLPGAAGLLLAIVGIIFANSLILTVLDFVKMLSSDNEILPVTATRLRGGVEFALMVLLGGSLLLVTGLFDKIAEQIEWKALQRFFLTDPLSSKQNWSIVLFLGGLGAGLILHLHLLVLGGPIHEGMIEQISTVLFFLSGLALLFSVMRLGRIHVFGATAMSLRLSLSAVGFFFLWVAGEEISWGQRIFNWETFGVFAEYNVQKETNLHNFFNRSFRYIYPTFGMGVFMFLSLLFAFGKNRQDYLFQLLMPHPALLIPIFFLSCSSFIGENETFEALFSAIVILYSFRILYCVTFPAPRYAAAQ